MIKNENNVCPFFNFGIENFGILLKGKSLELISKYHDKFDDCFILSDFEYELPIVGKYLKGKNIVHFTNRSSDPSLNRASYKSYNIKHIQLGQVFRFNHYRLIRTLLFHKIKNFGINVHTLPENTLKYNQDFSEDYYLKFPNTGILSIIYTLDLIRPKNLWIFGLDFYSVDYLSPQQQFYSRSRRDSSLNVLFDSDERLMLQQQKSDRLNIPEYFFSLVDKFSDINFHMGSYYKEIPKKNNLIILK